ncbi:MAG: hypothetical protein WEB06_12620 [Actinomycetota bacterium]
MSFRRSDLYGQLPRSLLGRVDVITAYTPFVPVWEVFQLPAEAREYEPVYSFTDMALDGTAALRAIIARWLRPSGWLLLQVASEHIPPKTAATVPPTTAILLTKSRRLILPARYASTSSSLDIAPPFAPRVDSSQTLMLGGLLPIVGIATRRRWGLRITRPDSVRDQTEQQEAVARCEVAVQQAAALRQFTDDLRAMEEFLAMHASDEPPQDRGRRFQDFLTELLVVRLGSTARLLAGV